MKVIAIDGPAGCGKSTVARKVAQKLGIFYLDSGAIYRTVTLLLLRSKVDISRKNGEMPALLQKRTIDLESVDTGVRVLLNGDDVTRQIRSPQVTAHVSTVSENKSVREAVNNKIRALAENRTVVLEGRDIGTVVFPRADLKIFMSASLKERARRRYEELRAAGVGTSLQEIELDIARRDKHDSERELAPLRQAADAIVLDTTNLTIDEAVDFVINAFNKIEHES
ncbi:MAG: (d)CMP kinase [bacterium]